MNKRSDTKSGGKPKEPERASGSTAQTISVLDGDKTPREELMKTPKAYVIDKMAIPVDKTRFLLDVDNQTTQGKQIIALMEGLRDGDVAALKAFTEILGALSMIVAKKQTTTE
jgi:hypothetical protein